MDDDDDVSADASPSPVSSPAASALPVAEPVTVASAPPGGVLALALPIQRTAASLYASAGGGGGGGGGREDAWSEGATSALIDAWGERFVALGRGSLRHPQWQEVADAVSSRDGYSKAPKSDIQCKNRIDTLKKKYKIERAKPVSSWQFFDRLDALLAPTYDQKPAAAVADVGRNPNGRNPVPAALRVGFPQRSRTPLMPAAAAALKRRAPSPEPSASSESSDGFPPMAALPAANGKRRRTDEGRGDGGSAGDRTQGLRELSQAIRRLGEAYERVETAKLEQAAEMERRRMDFARELESQRVQFFLNTQMELSQTNNQASPGTAGATTVGGASRRMSTTTDAGASSNHHGRYRISHSDRHRHAQRPRYEYHDNNLATAAVASDGEQSDDEEEDEEEEESQ
ncbi:trihelix transcription factor ASIL2-like [Phragmites australis]|uniref:trihelix transcription factor ASIL2-like n=1 Tax=Phragmites australis TaxID=29695 RepID=UPI002D77FF61|nr:trihelix transcription factor ASIL2-like [Phragmites australis]